MTSILVLTKNGLRIFAKKSVEVLFVALKQLLEEDLVETPAPFLFVPFKGTEIGENLKRPGIEIVSNFSKAFR